VLARSGVWVFLSTPVCDLRDGVKPKLSARAERLLLDFALLRRNTNIY
jgi:hypothetical protein